MRSAILALFLGISFSLNLSILDYDNPSATHILDAEVVDDLLIVVGMIGGIEFYDISNPESLNHLTSFNLSSGGGGGGGGGGAKPNCVSVSGDYAYITTKNGVAIIDISNPSNPQSLGYVSNTNNLILENLDTHDDLLAVAAHEDGVLLYDITNPSNPTYISTIEADNAWAVAIDDYHIYVADGSTLLDYFKLESFENEYALLASIELSNAIKDITIGDGYVYAAIGSDGVVAINIMADVTPQITDIYDTSAMANRLDIFDGNKIAVSDWDDVEVLSLEPEYGALSLVGYKNTTRRTMAIATKENYIYSAEWASVQVFEFGEIDGPDIDLSAYELNYPYVENGSSESLFLDVMNNGSQTLNVSSNYTTNSEFNVVNPLTSLEPGESQTVEIEYFANSENSSGSYRIFSNDEDESEIICETNGNINGANIGDEAPDFNLQIVANGNGSFQLSDQIGSVIVIAFFAPNWPVCSPELSDMETSIWQEYNQDEVVTIGIINTNSQNQINTFVEENSITFPILYDPGSSGGVQGGDTYDDYYMPNDGSPYPRDFIVDQEGIIQYANNEIDFEWMLYVIENLLGGDYVLGDVNSDGSIDILDIVLMVNIILSVLEPTDLQLQASDLNVDGVINILDIVQIVNIILS